MLAGPSVVEKISACQESTEHKAIVFFVTTTVILDNLKGLWIVVNQEKDAMVHNDAEGDRKVTKHRTWVSVATVTTYTLPRNL